jgi:hypothetical protein
LTIAVFLPSFADSSSVTCKWEWSGTEKLSEGSSYWLFIDFQMWHHNALRFLETIYIIQGASVNWAILQHCFFSGLATLGRVPLSPFCCEH